jgi:hypothetical protein
MWHRVIFVWTDVSEDRRASIFRIEEYTSGEPEWASSCRFLARRFFYHEDGGDTILRNVDSHKNYTAPHPRNGILHSHRRENLKYYKLNLYWTEKVRLIIGGNDRIVLTLLEACSSFKI